MWHSVGVWPAAISQMRVPADTEYEYPAALGPTPETPAERARLAECVALQHCSMRRLRYLQWAAAMWPEGSDERAAHLTVAAKLETQIEHLEEEQLRWVAEHRREVDRVSAPAEVLRRMQSDSAATQ